MKRVLSCLGVAVSLIILGAVFSDGAWAATGKPTIRIGVSNSMTGGFSVYAVDFQKGIEFGVAEINEKGGIDGNLIELVSRDDESDAVRAANNVRALAEAGCLAMVGFADFGLQTAAAPVVEEVKLPCVQLAPIDPPYVEPGGYDFGGIWWNMESATLARLKAFAGLGLHRVAHMAPKDPVGEINEKFLRQLAPKAGVELVATEWMLLTDTDVTPQLMKLRMAKTEAIFNDGSGQAAVVQFKSLKRLGWKVPMAANDANTTPSFIDAVGEDADIALALACPTALRPDSIPRSVPTRDQIIAFKKKYFEKTGKVAGSIAAQGYDAIRSLVPVLEQAKLHPGQEKIQAMRDRIRNDLENQCFQGLDWKICRTPKDHKGAQEAKFYISRIQGKQWVPITEADLANFR
jgi:branched-chain amino acid transport system substrate-binding protein